MPRSAIAERGKNPSQGEERVATEGSTATRRIQGPAVSCREIAFVILGRPMPKVVSTCGRWIRLPRSSRFGLCHVGSDRIHQRRRQAIIWLKSEFLQPAADLVRLLGLDAGFDDGRSEGPTSASRPAASLA